MSFVFMRFVSRDMQTEAAARALYAALRAGIESRGRAALMASGGASPVATYEMLRSAPLPWEKVSIGMVDERWVAPDDPRSNEKLIRDKLLHDGAGRANFVPMKRAHAHAADAVVEVNADYAGLPSPFDAIVLGMGVDGHTASWLPGADGLAEALDDGSPALACAIMGRENSPAARERMTLTARAVVFSPLIILLLQGGEKFAAFQRALTAPILEAPVRLLVERAPGLRVYWAP